MSLLNTLVVVCEPWATLYGGSTPLSVGLTFAHLGSMMVGGGLALAADRTVLRVGMPATPEARLKLADTVGDVHRPVVSALAFSAMSGGLQLAADLETLAVSKVMWVKIGLLLLLGINGFLMLRNEQGVRDAAGAVPAFRALRMRAITSVVLWLAITLAGVGLMQG